MDAPEKIWIDVEPYELHWHEGEPPAGYVHARGSYTRTDLANELVAAAYEDAAQIYDRTFDSFAKLIREHTPADAVAALAARDARIREAALREAYVNLKTYRPHEVDGPEHDVGYTAGYVTAMNRIEALIAKDKANG